MLSKKVTAFLFTPLDSSALTIKLCKRLLVKKASEPPRKKRHHRMDKKLESKRLENRGQKAGKKPGLVAAA